MGLDRIYRHNSASLLLCAHFTLSDAAGAQLPVYLDCDPIHAVATSSAAGGAPSGAARGVATGSGGRGLHFVVWATDQPEDETEDETEDVPLEDRFEGCIGGVPIGLTGLLVQVRNVLAPYEGSGLRWEEACDRCDVYGRLLDRLDASKGGWDARDDVASSSEEGGVVEADVEEEEEIGEDDDESGSDSEEEDEYPASMLGDDDMEESWEE